MLFPPARGHILLLALLPAAFAEPSWALDPGKAITQYQQDFWGEEDGLPQASVQALTQTKAGYIWIGTRDGLARFDGTKFTIYRSDDHPGLLSDDIRSLYEDNLGRLWVGTFNGGVSCFENGAFRAYSAAEGLRSKGVLSIYQDYYGNLWFGTWRGIAKFNRGRFDYYSEAEGVQGKSAWSFAEDANHLLWAATERALHTFQDSQFRVQQEISGFPFHDIRKIHIDRQGAYWVGTLNGLIRIAKGKERVFTTADGLADNRVRTMAEDKEGNLWVATWDGLSRIQGEHVSSSTAKSGERLSAVIDALLVDSDGSLWMGLRGGGLGRLRDAKFSNFTTQEGLPSKLPRCVFQSGDGAIWVGTDGGGLARMKGESVLQITKSNGLPSNFVASLAEGEDGTIWAGLGRPAAIAAIRDGTIEKILTSSDGLPCEYSVRALFVDKAGILWAGGDGGLCQVLADHIEPIRGLPAPPVRVISEDREGRMWIGTDDGLCVLRGTKVESVFTTAHGLSHNAVYSFHQDKAGVIWLGTQQGLTQFKNGKFRSMPRARGRFHGTIYTVLDDEEETLWTSSSRGISAVKKSAVEAVLDGRVAVLESVSFGKADGLKSTQCTGGSQRPGCKTRDGRLWFATLNGLAVIQPNQRDPNEQAPPVLIEEIRANRLSAAPNIHHQFAPDTDDFEFHYTALKFITPERVQFRYQLAGHDKGWVHAGTRRTAYYNNLRPGVFTFQVSASSDGVTWSEPVKTAAFVLEPHFYQTGWFYTACAAGLLAIGFAFHRHRLSKERERFAMVLAERTRIARDLHDTMAQGFAGTAFQLEALRSNLSDAPAETQQHLDLALTMVRHSFAEAKRAVLNLRSPLLENSDLVTAVSETGRQMLAESGVTLIVNTRGKPRRLSPEVETQLLRICQEALANAMKHAHASRIEFSFDFSHSQPEIVIKDNGAGFDLESADKRHGHQLGLRGMRERMKQLGGRIEICTAPGNGTEIKVHLN